MTGSRVEAPRGWAGAALLVVVCGAVSTAILAVVLLDDRNAGLRNDFHAELWPAYRSLYAGQLHAALSMTPGYIGAAVWRAPLALAAIACGAGWRVTYLVTAAPCFAAVTLFGIWFAGRLRPDRPGRRRIILGFALFSMVDPVLWYSGVLGHPEEMVGAVLALAAILLAVEGRVWLAGVLLVLALLNKPGLAEVVPVVLVATRTRHMRLALVLCMLVAIAYAVYELSGLYYHFPIHELTAGITLGGGFFPPQLLWWLGPNAWVSVHEHVLLVPACVLLVAAWWYRPGPWAGAGDGPPERLREVLWLAAFLCLFRTTFDPWNNTYYSLPLVLCLFGLEAGGWPVITVAASVAVVLAVPSNDILSLSAGGQAALYAAVAVPALAALGWRAYFPHRPRRKHPHSDPFPAVLPSVGRTPTLPPVSQ